jgi:hypothetical protein
MNNHVKALISLLDSEYMIYSENFDPSTSHLSKSSKMMTFEEFCKHVDLGIASMAHEFEEYLLNIGYPPITLAEYIEYDVDDEIAFKSEESLTPDEWARIHNDDYFINDIPF